MKKYIIPALAIVIFLAGLASLMLPFLPFGWLFLALAALLVAPYFKFMRRFIGWLAKKDNSGLVKKAGGKAARLYRWAEDEDRAGKLETIIEENSDEDGEENSKEN